MQQEELNQIIAENMAKYRKAANLTQLELAEKLNYSDKSVSKWEQGNGMPDIFVLYSLANLYGVTVNDFMQKHEDTPPMPNKNKRAFNRLLILLMSVGLTWLVAVAAFVFVNLFAPDFTFSWLAFIYALPVTFIVTLVFSCIWGFYLLRPVSVSALIWTLLLSVCLTVVTATGANGIFMLFIIGIPLQILVILWFIFYGKPRKNKR